MTPRPSTTTAAPTTELTHDCVRCGAPTALDRGLCEGCNPLGLRDASSSQVHGTAFLGVLVAVIVLAVVARAAVSGVGPFDGAVASVEGQDGGLAITLTVTNDGSASGQTTCRVTDPSLRGGGPSEFILSPRIEPGETVTFTKVVTRLGSEPRTFDVTCASP
jgi:hypothetical protein